MYIQRRQHKEAISELQRAIYLDPNDPSCYQSMGFALSMAGSPKEAIDYINRGMRLDPNNPSGYLWLLGLANFCKGELAEAAALSEKALRLNPENVGMGVQVAVFYGLLSRDREARAALETVKKKLWVPNLESYMYFLPFKDRAVADRYAEGLLKAGVSAQPSRYFPAFKENQLTGEEIRALLFGSTITGISWNFQWWNEWRKDGRLAWRTPTSSDSGKCRIEGDMVCTQYQNNLWGLEECATVFKNPLGTPEGKDEYFLCSDIGFTPFSLVK
jgi:hypothetical protein